METKEIVQIIMTPIFAYVIYRVVAAVFEHYKRGRK